MVKTCLEVTERYSHSGSVTDTLTMRPSFSSTTRQASISPKPCASFVFAVSIFVVMLVARNLSRAVFASS